MRYFVAAAHEIESKRAGKHGVFLDKRILKIDQGFTGSHDSKYSAFLVAPSFTYYKADIPTMEFSHLKTYFSEHFILKGCGTVITNFTIDREFEFEEKLKAKRLSLLNSPIDYVLGVQLPVSKISPGLIRKCKKNHIPIIFLDLLQADDLYSVPWGWIKEAAFPENPVLIPRISVSSTKLNKRFLLKKWTSILSQENISHLSTLLDIGQPLTTNILKKIGIYPKKGILRTNAEISYNLFLNTSTIDFNTVPKPTITVLKGKVMSVDHKVFFHPGMGEELNIRKTALFV